MRLSLFTLTAAVFSMGIAHAQTDAFHITEAEKAACTVDAERFCLGAYPDERKLLICMKQNMGALSTGCASVFKAGLKRRGLPG